jgi:hypothetical protein
MWNPRSFLGVIGVMLFLVALYLVLEYATGASGVIAALSAAGVQIFGTLQGRSVSVNAGGVAVTGH